MIKAAVSRAPITSVAADAVIVAIDRHEGAVRIKADPAAVPDDVRRQLELLFARVGAGTGIGDTTVIPSPAPMKAPVVIGTALGPTRIDITWDEVLRRAAGAGARAGRAHETLAFAMPASDPAAVVEGALLGLYSFEEYRTTASKPAMTTSITVLGADLPATSMQRSAAVMDAVMFCRDLVNTPPGDLRPSMFAERVRAAARPLGLQVDVIDAERLVEQGSGGILGVGRGSSDSPLLIRMSHRGPDSARNLALVGKGITFDSGGLSLKPPKSMETMKCDMSGAAAVAATLLALARLGTAASVTGWLAVAENMPGGDAQRPGDVIRMFGGKTVEVLNTDAEGRLVLGDALVRAAQDHPDAIIDIATLTGAQMVALGATTAGVMGNSGSLRDTIARLGHQVGEALWPMPLPPELRPSLDSPIADIANIGDRTNGGMLTAGLFLQEFVPPEIPWAHIDIAGPAFNTAAAAGYTPKGGTGFGVRTLVAAAEALAVGSLLPPTG